MQNNRKTKIRLIFILIITILAFTSCTDINPNVYIALGIYSPVQNEMEKLNENLSETDTGLLIEQLSYLSDYGGLNDWLETELSEQNKTIVNNAKESIKESLIEFLDNCDCGSDNCNCGDWDNLKDALEDVLETLPEEYEEYIEILGLDKLLDSLFDHLDGEATTNEDYLYIQVLVDVITPLPELWEDLTAGDVSTVLPTLLEVIAEVDQIGTLVPSLGLPSNILENLMDLFTGDLFTTEEEA